MPASIFAESNGLASQALRFMTGMKQAYFASEHLAWIAIPVGLICVAMFWWSYRGTGLSWPFCVLGMSLKITAVLALLFCVLEPMNIAQRPKDGENLLLLVADNSKSLTIKDNGATQTRADELSGALQSELDWQEDLQESFDLRRFQFGSRLQAVQKFDLDFTETRSTLSESLREIAARFESRPVAGVVLFTDGNVGELALEEIEALGLPAIYPVIIGRDEPDRDLRLTQVSVSQTNFEASPVRMLVEYDGVGHVDGAVQISLHDTAGKVVATQKTKLHTDSQANLVRFQIRPEEPGVLFYRVVIRALDGESKTDEYLEEATLANNELNTVVDRGGGPYRVLYVSGRPNWEYKFLRRAIQEDLETELVGLLRIARREPKFSFRSRPGESSNPLFRGFEDADEEETEQYDQPVFLRVDTEPEELREGFPKVPADLLRYDAVVLDDVDAKFFTNEQMQLLSRFVSERGGGLIMLGGQESFSEGGFKNTPVEDLLPIYLGKPSLGGSSETYEFELARDGWLQPWARLRTTQADEQKRIATMPKFAAVNRTRRIKPGAEQIATLRSRTGSTLPALATQNFGRGRSAALLVGDMWRWEMRRPDHRESDPQTQWRQIIRWLVADVPQRVEVKLDRSQLADVGKVNLQVQVSDEEFSPLDNASVIVNLTAPDGKTMKLATESSASEAGVYTTDVYSNSPGPYLAEVSVTSEEGEVIDLRQVGWTADPDYEEFRQLKPNTEWLNELAEQTGGKVLELDELERFSRQLKRKPAPVMETVRYELWHQSFLFLLAVCLLASEWGMRRWRGLA